MNKSLVQAQAILHTFDVFFPLPMCGSSLGGKSPKKAAGMLLRWSFSLSLIFMGLTHYMQIASFRVLVSDGLGPLMPLGTIWAYVMPGLFIIGGALLLVGKFLDIGAWAAGVALASIPAGMLLKSVMTGADLGMTMPAAINAFIWLIVFRYAVKNAACGSCCKSGVCAPMGNDACGCGSAGCGCSDRK